MNIKIIEKPDWILWDDIHELLLQAHKKNIEKGIVSLYAQMSGNEIQNKLGNEGRCWVALDEGKLVGCTAVSFFIGNKWWNKGKRVAHSCFTGLLQNYQGLGIIVDLDTQLMNYVKELGVDMIEGDTAEKNCAMRKLLELGGYKTVDFIAFKSNHYSVKSVKWLNECPFSDKYINRRLKISEKLTKWQYKPGKIERSQLVSFLCRNANRLVKYYYGD